MLNNGVYAMSNATNNISNVPNPTVTTVTDFKHDAVNWAKRGNKLVYGNVADLTIDPVLNIRNKLGAVKFGVTVSKDTYDLPGMKQQLVDGGGIQEPLLVSVRADGKKVVVRGNRRASGGQELLADPTLSAEMRKALTESTPMILLTGLTIAQEQELVEDQTQKPFMRNEVVQHIFTLRKMGWTFERIAMLLWETLGRWTGNAKKIAEVREIVDPVLKREKVKVWLRGSLDCYLIWGCDIGAWVQKQIVLSEMKLDGVLPIGTTEVPVEQPYVIMTKNSQKRILALKKAKEADGAKFSPLMLIEGTEFKKVADTFHAEDYGTQTVTPKATVKKMPDRKTVEGFRDTFQSAAVRAAFSLVLGDPSPEMQVRDDATVIFETKMLLVEQYLPRLKPEVAAIVRSCLVNADPVDFQTMMEANCIADDVIETVPTEQAESSNSETEFSLADATATDDGNPTDPVV